MPRSSARSTTFNDDDLALLCLTTTLGRSALEVEEPLGPMGWHELKRAIGLHGREPGWLLGASELGLRAIGIPVETARLVLRRMERQQRVIEDAARLRERGCWIVTERDEHYPARLARLGDRRPVVLYGVGEAGLLEGPSLAVVGSRELDAAGTAFATVLGVRTAEMGWVLVSGGARGADMAAMRGAADAGGCVVGVLSADLPRWARTAEHAEAIADGRLTLVTIAHPEMPFANAIALARNKVIYALGEASVVVACDVARGGTRHGAREALTHGWGPVLVREGADAPEGNRLLLREGGSPLRDADVSSADHLREAIRAAQARDDEARSDAVAQPRLIDAD